MVSDELVFQMNDRFPFSHSFVVLQASSTTTMMASPTGGSA